MTKYKEEYIHSDHLLYVQLGENVRKLRKQRKLSQHELAEQIDSDQKQISRIERGEARPNLTLCLIPASYFRDFADNATPEYVNGLPADDKPAVVIIKDYPAFKQRLIEKMLSLGIRREEIIEIGVSYIDFEQFGESGWWDFGQRSPRELAVKHIRFANQSEGRFIINTQRSEVRKMLSAPIEIGSLEDISQLCNQYFYDGIQVTSQVSVDEQP